MKILLAVLTSLPMFRGRIKEVGEYPLIRAFTTWNLISFLVHTPVEGSLFVNVFLRFCSSGVIYPFYETNIYFKIIVSASSSGNLSYQWALFCIDKYKYCLNGALLSANGQSGSDFTTQTNHYIYYTLYYVCDL